MERLSATQNCSGAAQRRLVHCTAFPEFGHPDGISIRAVYLAVTGRQRLESSTAVLPRGLARLGHWLFEPSRWITEVTERRRARLLAKLLLAQAFLLIQPIVSIPRTETGRTGELLPPLLLAHLVFILVCYAFSRTRRVRAAVWAYVVNALSFPPIVLVLTAPTGGISPLMSVLALFPPVLFVNALISARAALVTGLLALVPMLLSHQLFGNPYWSELMLAGGALFLTFTILAVIFGVYRDGIEADRVTELQVRNQELEELRKTLDQKVETRTQELSDRNAALRLVLDNVVQGIFIVARSGIMPAEHSAVLSKWFGPIQIGETFFRYLGRSSPQFAAMCEVGWEQLLDDFLPLDVALAQLPSSLQTGPKSYRLSYEQIDGDQDGRILIVVSDVTFEVERERAELEKKETFNVFEHVLDNRRGFVEFMTEATGLMAQVCAPSTQHSDRLRALHTLKGNSMLFGIQSVAHRCHELESQLAAGESLDEKQLALLSERWQRLSADMDRLLGGQTNVIEISLEQHTALKRTAREYSAPQELIGRIDSLAFEPVDRRLSHFVDHAQRLADRFEKRVRVDVVHDDIYLDERPWPLLWAVLVHAIRNAIDHGIEPAAERQATGKPELGQLWLRARREAANIILEIEDDGRGLDWGAIGRKCETMNLPSSSRAELLEGLFAEGMSTAEQVTDISGRGIGMGALRSAVRSLCGELFVESESGRGTLLRMVFPPTSCPSSSIVPVRSAGAVSLRAQADR